MTNQPARLPLMLIGVLIGTVASFLGIGGGILIVLLLTIGFTIPHKQAAGTSLGVVVFVAGAAVTVDLISGSPRVRPALLAVVLVAPTAMLAARVVTPWIHRIPTAVLRRVFGIVLLVAAAKMFSLPPFESTAGGLLHYSDWPVLAFLVLPVLGLAIGTVATLVGIGGGVILIPALGLLFSDLTWLQCRATSLFVVLPTAFTSFAHHAKQGTALLPYVRMLAPACAAGSVAGSFLVHGVDTVVFQRAFGGFLVLMALRLFLTRPQTGDI